MSEQNSQLLNFKKWKIGNVTVTRILEMDPMHIPPEWLLQTTAETINKHAWLQPNYATPDGQIIANIQGFVIEASGRRILVDPCVGNDKPRESVAFNKLNNPFLERLTAAGFPPEAIDYVLCTHLHVDHAGWNTRLVDGKWVPTFPNARYLFGRVEVEYAKLDDGLDAKATFEDSVQPILDAGLADLVEFDFRIGDEVFLEPSPGHTPGHCYIRISSMGEEGVITGDLIHHPIQACEPDVCSNFCFNTDQARATRRLFLEKYSETNTLVLGTHFAEPTGVRILPNGNVWKVEEL